MPIQKPQKKREPLWKEWDVLAQKDGVRKTVFLSSREEYTGEWKDNKKHGKGVQIWQRTGARYDGDWKEGKRNGFGTYSTPSDDGMLMKQYSGGWKNDMKHGYGTRFYSEDEFYEGEWYADKRSGWGRQYYIDGSVYEGEWFGDKRCGKGLLRLASGNRYEGSWQEDLKHGPGKFFYLDKGQVYTGHWANGVAKCGFLEDFSRDEAPDPPVFPIPECKLRDPAGVVNDARSELQSSI